ncbi:e3 ubiquitin-protein ligase ubr3 [Lasius niger]|uniref:E3 ubiquitin-protein ligase n=1 Tax=Lasius niger TaxID=67767 RepID=A0A0J7L5A6_LASNI|nr:e3 ubiquitin-protein ligase ubr3 [Lasius niger]
MDILFTALFAFSVAFYEILNGLWVRNGLQIKGQAMTYIQCNFCNSMVDADLYLLQICATKLLPDVFLKTIIEKFHVKEWMSLCLYRAPQNEYLEGEHDTPMLESCLTFLATLINVRTNLGLSDPEMSRLEMVTLLCMGDKTHSQLMELMPERCGTTQNRDFESVLADMSPLCQYTGGSSRMIKDMDLGGWYESDSLSENLRTVIPRVILVQESEPNSSDSEFEWEIQGEMSEVATSLMLNDGVDDGAEEGSLELLGFSVDTVRDDSGVSNTMEYDLIVPEDGIVAIPRSNSEDDLTIPLQRALPPSGEESMALAIESPPSPNNVIGGQPALLPAPQRPAVMAGSEIVAAQPVNYRTTEIVPSTSNPHKHFKRREPQVGLMQPQTVKVGESIISLLLKLHSQLSGVPDSYNPEQSAISDNEAGSSSSSSSSSFASPSSLSDSRIGDSRIGDGPFFISQLLRKIADLDPMCRQTIIETRNKLWPRMQECEEDEQREKENREREERRRRAKERQQKLMAEFANKQKQFMEKAMKTEEASVSGMDWDQEENATKLASKKEYDCVICNQTTPSSEDKPMGLVVLVQATSIIGHERQESDRLVLPTSDEDPSIPKGNTRGAHFDRRMDEMSRLFHTFSWLISVNLGWEGGVHVQTCGHHLHLDCLKSYLESLRSQQRQQSLAVDRGEYLCPLCRQLANSVLPLSPQLGECSAVVRSRHASTKTIFADLNTFLKEVQRNPVSSNLAMAMGKAMEDMTSCTYLKYKQKNCKPSHQSLFLFVTSVARTNFEIELVQRGGSLCVPPPTTIPLTPKRDCIAYFSGIVKVLYNLLYYQVILQISCNFSRAERNTILKRRCNCAATPSETILAEIIEYFSESGLYSGPDDDKPSTSSSPTYARVKTHCVEQQIQSLCLPFLRVASLLRYHLYEQPLPLIRTPQSEFVRLVYYLELVTEGMSWESFDSTVALNWQDPETTVSVPLFWCDQLLAFLASWQNHQPARGLIREQHISWHMPKLLSLPREYEKIFTYYHERQCSQCHSVPQEISICLLCGTIVCLKQTCCKQMNVCEAIQHSIDCGGGTGIYLVVTSTYIIVIRGRRACLWGSLYLDDFEEEDRDLKRGKPLYLSQDRYQLLEQQWLAHRFDHTKKTWVWHRDAL